MKTVALMLTLATLAGIAIGAGLLSLFGDDARPLPEPKRFAIPLSEGERIRNYFLSWDNPSCSRRMGPISSTRLPEGARVFFTFVT